MSNGYGSGSSSAPYGGASQPPPPPPKRNTSSNQRSGNLDSGYEEATSIAEILGALTQMGLGIYAATQIGGTASSGRRMWNLVTPTIHSQYQNLFAAPWAQGSISPYQMSTWQGGGMSPSVMALRRNFLERQYGLPSTVSRAMVAQSQRPLQINRGMIQGLTPAQAQLGTAMDPSQYATAALQTQMPQYMQQKDYLQSAAAIAAYNAYRAQSVSHLLA